MHQEAKEKIIESLGQLLLTGKSQLTAEDARQFLHFYRLFRGRLSRAGEK